MKLFTIKKRFLTMALLMSLTLAGLFTFTACDSCDNGGEPPVRNPYEDPIPTELKSTRTFKALDAVERKVYIMDLSISDGSVVFDFVFYRNGNDMTLTVLNDLLTDMIHDGKIYDIDVGKQTAALRDATAADIKKLADQFEEYEKIVNLHGATFVKEGTETFLNRGETLFEEFKRNDGRNQRAYFNEDNELIGITFLSSGVETQMHFHIIPEAPEDWAFDPVTWGYTVL